MSEFSEIGSLPTARKSTLRCLLNAALGLVCISVAAQAFADDLRTQVERYRIAHEAQLVGQLDELTRIKSVAAEPTGLAAAANGLQALLKARGFDAMQLSAKPGMPPLVFGELKSPGARRTVVFYAHYDGQPVTLSQWSSDPFIPVMRSGPLNSGEHESTGGGAKLLFNPEWRLFGRAVSDDKALIVAFAEAFDALEASMRKLSVDVKVAWEGEEEVSLDTPCPKIARAESGALSPPTCG